MSLDTQLLFFFNNLAGQSSLVDSAIVFLATYLAYILIILFLGLLFFSAYQRREKIEILLVTGLSALVARFGITEVIRFFIHRPRPFVTFNLHPLVAESSYSFPSGHAMFFFAMATAIYLYHKKWGTAFFIGAALICAARIAAGVHYPSDILGGAIIGATTAYFIYFFTQKWVTKPTHYTY